MMVAPPNGNIFLEQFMNAITRMFFLQNERFLGKVDFDQWLGHDKLTFIDSIYKPQHNVQVKAYLH